MTAALASFSLMSCCAAPRALSIARAPSSRRRRGAGEGSQIGLHSHSCLVGKGLLHMRQIFTTLPEAKHSLHNN